MSNTHYKREKHQKILQEFTFNEYKHRTYGYKKVTRRVSHRMEGSVTFLDQMEERVSSAGCIIYPEFAEYCFLLEGCAKKLLLYLIFHHVDEVSNRFVFNDQVIYDFNRYHILMESNSRSYRDETVKSALRELADSNIIQNLKKGEYMMNPMIIGGKNFANRKSLISEYSMLLLRKGKDPVNKFYPV